MNKKAENSSNVLLLKEIAELLNEETEMQPMLTQSLQRFLNGTAFTTGWIFFVSNQDTHKLMTHVGLPPALSDQSCLGMKEGNCWCVSKYRKGTLKKASNIMECKRVEDAISAEKLNHEGILYHATVPLRSGEESFGLLNVAAPYKSFFNHEELALLESVAFQIGSAIKRIMLNKKEQDIMVMAERNRLARDLHDSVNQLLFSLTLTARGGKERAADEEIKEIFQDIHGLSQQALSEMRALIWQLRPKGLEKGLIEAIKDYGDLLGLSLLFTVKGVISLPGKIEEALWRIAQEALNNCKKHAGTTKIHIYLESTANEMKLSIKDNGRGFHAESFQSLPSLGIQSMKERVESFQGDFKLISESNKGTEIKVLLPL
ncbi:GAF domain-containing sensor histidine kinase [Bacillus sp. 2205SS5-2]|uniref:GAF domain-containing sensor histidine kinase n=1 Tax=Bacillus sp. 2205SS5-2 TaxID=3109031 RepID=UPI003005076B